MYYIDMLRCYNERCTSTFQRLAMIMTVDCYGSDKCDLKGDSGAKRGLW